LFVGVNVQQLTATGAVLVYNTPRVTWPSTGFFTSKVNPAVLIACYDWCHAMLPLHGVADIM
jgi:hypothetical protein